MKDLKTINNGWLRQDDGIVYLIKINSSGKEFKFQWNGCACNYQKYKGILVSQFKSEHNYFNSDFWYNRVSWFDNEELIKFMNDEEKNEFSNISYSNFEKADSQLKSLEKKFRLSAISANNVLETILSECKKETNLDIKFRGECKFGKTWGEAFIPVYINNSKSIVTWKNCD